MKRFAMLLPLLILTSSVQAQDASKIVSVEVERDDYLVDNKSVHSEAEVLERLRHIEGLKQIRFLAAQDAPYQRVAHLLAAIQKSGLPISIGLVGNETFN